MDVHLHTQPQHVARLLHAAGPGGMDALPLIQQAKAHAEAVWRHRPEEVIEARGRAGDVVFTHPFLVHARSTNCAPPGAAEGVRFMCHPGVRLRAHPSFGVAAAGEADSRSLTPLEKGVVSGLDGAEVFAHDACIAQWAKEEEERRGVAAAAREQHHADDGGGTAQRGSEAGGAGGGGIADGLPEGVDEAVWAAMGITGFGAKHRRKRTRGEEGT